MYDEAFGVVNDEKSIFEGKRTCKPNIYYSRKKKKKKKKKTTMK
jgi:hypothetical protein